MVDERYCNSAFFRTVCMKNGCFYFRGFCLKHEVKVYESVFPTGRGTQVSRKEVPLYVGFF